MIRQIAVLAVVAAALTGCDKTEFETTPVTVTTPQGDVTCQLYRHDMVMWDTALSRPADMTDEVANNACIEEGERRKADGT